METAIHVRVGEGQEELLSILLFRGGELSSPFGGGSVSIGGLALPFRLNFLLDLNKVVPSHKALRVCCCLHPS